MRYRDCPLCGEPVEVGSHWDCVFEMMADWVPHREPAPEVHHTEGVKEKEGEKNG